MDMETLIYPLSLVLVGIIIQLCLYLFVDGEQEEDVEKGEKTLNSNTSLYERSS